MSDRIPFHQADMFGFTRDATMHTAALQWRDDAVRDAWSIEPTYGDSESVDRAWRLSRDGFSVQGISRLYEPGRKWAAEASIHIWGPDGLAIKTPSLYDFAEIEAGLTTCEACGAKGVKTQRVAFANRCCTACVPAQRKELERHGWTN
jgi:hypothetical protein